MVPMMCVKLIFDGGGSQWLADSVVIFPFIFSVHTVFINKQKRHANTLLFPICGVILKCNLKWVATKNGLCGVTFFGDSSQIMRV
jgi:hypothetical protein